MNAAEHIRRTLNVAARECGILRSNMIYLFCMVIFPVVIVFFFTSLMSEGQPEDMPVGVVDMDNTTTTRSMTRKLDAFQNTRVVRHFNDISEARSAMQQNEIYAFLYFPAGTTDKLMSMRQPKISIYYSNTSLTAGALLSKDLKIIATLGSAGAGSAQMSAKGYTERQIMAFLQPVVIDLHTIQNPWVSYNIYLSTMLIPGCIMLFIFLITVYSIGTELKFGRSKEWLAMAGNSIYVAVAGKMLPQFIVFITITLAYMLYVFGILDFPHPGGTWTMILLGLLSVVSAQGFGIFMFGLMPSLRMSMSTCSLWAVISFSLSGAAYPIFSMSPAIEALAQLFPLRHYYMVYQICVFNGFPLSYAWFNIAALAGFACLPVFIMRNLKRAMLEFVYIP